MSLVAAIPSSVLCRTLHWELPEDIFPKKKYKEKYIPKRMPQPVRILLVSKIIQHYNENKMDFPKIKYTINNPTQSK